jgi:hypothetical protein
VEYRNYMKIQMTPLRLLTKAEAAHNVPFGTWMFSYEQSGPRCPDYSHEQRRVAGTRGAREFTEGVAHAAELFSSRLGTFVLACFGDFGVQTNSRLFGKTSFAVKTVEVSVFI